MVKLTFFKLPLLKKLLKLNQHFPPGHRELWVTKTEMRERFIHCGVHQSLSVDIVEAAITRANKGSCLLKRRRQGSEPYYQPIICGEDYTVPQDLRIRASGHRCRDSILPDKGCLTIDPTAEQYITEINDALIEYILAVVAEKTEERRIARAARQAVAAEVAEAAAREAAEAEAAEAEAAAEAQRIQEQWDAGTNDDSIDFGAGDSESDETATTDGTPEEPPLPPPVIAPPPAPDYSGIEGNEGYGLFDIAMLCDFIHEATSHAAGCGVPVSLKEVNKKHGAGISQTWKCPKCCATLELKNCRWVKSVIETGRKWSRLQPEINLRIGMGARMNGINLEKLRGLLQGSMGVKVMNRKNARHLERKMRAAIHTMYGEMQKQNLRLHVESSKLRPDYKPIAFVHNGCTYVAHPGRASMDGVGKKRAYNHRINGDETALVVMSGEIGVPLTIVHSQVSLFPSIVYPLISLLLSLLLTSLFFCIEKNKCIKCTQTLMKQAMEMGDEFTVEALSTFSMEHDGICYRKSTIGLKVACGKLIIKCILFSMNRLLSTAALSLLLFLLPATFVRKSIWVRVL